MLMVQRVSYVAFAYHDGKLVCIICLCKNDCSGTTVDNTALNIDQLKQKVK